MSIREYSVKKSGYGKRRVELAYIFRKKLFTLGVVGHWEELPRECVDTLILGGVQGRVGWGPGCNPAYGREVL